MRALLLLSTMLLFFGRTYTQEQAGTKERIKVYSAALEGNLAGDNPERDVSVYLPPSYQVDTEKRYPVLYMLHGFTDSDGKWFGWEEGHWINLYDILNEAITEGGSQEMIVVMPNAYNRFQGSMYSSSVTVGDWETFIATELVDYIDTHYRTIPKPESRGLSGHSMGGYGTIRLAMKNPGVWSSIYLLSPCCMDDFQLTPGAAFMEKLENMTTDEELAKTNFFEIGTIASSAAWSPNPNNPPFYLDLPFADGEMRPDIAAKVSSNKILNIVDQYIFNLRRLNAIGMDAGNMDFTISGATKRLHDILTSYEVEHQFEIYSGDHVNRIGERIKTKVLPFFSEQLSFDP